MTARATRLHTALKLGRISNLPTVWTNVMTGRALAGATLDLPVVALAGLALSLFYVGGMYLNDAFDHRWDAQHRPERPIPAGEVQVGTVFVAGFAMLAVGLGMLAFGFASRRPAVGGLALGTLIVGYDLSHKNNPLSPLIMGLCRVAVYVTAALTAATLVRPLVWIGSGILLAYLVALSALAKQEDRFPALRPWVGRLIAGISLVDALLLMCVGHPIAAGLAGLGFLLTRRLQRRIAGT